ncbi:hypothetical protein, partial [Corynebacterium sp. HMSC077D03]|uniref:hypothetical protein n=1 Tax=Corynebacterium sp. HMSC077D03 TaxID=1739392 RepID=UPI001AEFC5CB
NTGTKNSHLTFYPPFALSLRVPSSMIPAATVCIENSRSEIGSDFRPGVLLYLQQLRQPQRRDIDEVMRTIMRGTFPAAEFF